MYGSQKNKALFTEPAGEHGGFAGLDGRNLGKSHGKSKRQQNEDGSLNLPILKLGGGKNNLKRSLDTTGGNRQRRIAASINTSLDASSLSH